MPDRQWWIEHPDGTRRRFAAGGLIIGRRADCDVVLRDPDTSRRHALVYLASTGPMIVPLGSAPTRVGGTVIEGPTTLGADDELEIGDLRLGLGCAEVEPEHGTGHWLLQRGAQGLFGLTHDRFTVGGSVDDDVNVPGLVDSALCFHSGPGRLAVEVSTEGVRIEPSALAAGIGEVVSLSVDDTIVVGTERFVVRGGDSVSTAATTGPHAGAKGGLPFDVRLEFLARGGRLCVRTDEAQTLVYLAGRRCDLAAVLLQPPEGHAPGEFVSDEVIAAGVWPGQQKGRTDINTLIHRLRQDLLRAGLDGVALVERSEGGGATRFALAPGATAKVH